jgi:hypothetical protein
MSKIRDTISKADLNAEFDKNSNFFRDLNKGSTDIKEGGGKFAQGVDKFGKGIEKGIKGLVDGIPIFGKLLSAGIGLGSQTATSGTQFALGTATSATQATIGAAGSAVGGIASMGLAAIAVVPILVLFASVVSSLIAIVTALVASIAGALLGAITVLGSALGALAIGMIGVVAILKPAISALLNAGKLDSTKTADILAYGKNSPQALADTKAIQQANSKDPGVSNAARSFSGLSDDFSNQTKSSRAIFYQFVTGLATDVKGAMPAITATINTSFAGFTRAATSFAKFLTSPSFQASIHGIGVLFSQIIGPIGKGFQNIIKIIVNIINGSAPYVREFAGWFEKASGHLADVTSNGEKVRKVIGTLWNDTKTWAGVIGKVVTFFKDLFAAGNSSGVSMAKSIGGMFDKLDAWAKGSGKNSLNDWFTKGKDLFNYIINQGIPSLVKFFDQIKSMLPSIKTILDDIKTTIDAISIAIKPITAAGTALGDVGGALFTPNKPNTGSTAYKLGQQVGSFFSSKSSGGFITGNGDKDNVHILAAPGEVVLNKHHQSKLAQWTGNSNIIDLLLGSTNARHDEPLKMAVGGYVKRRTKQKVVPGGRGGGGGGLPGGGGGGLPGGLAGGGLAGGLLRPRTQGTKSPATPNPSVYLPVNQGTIPGVPTGNIALPVNPTVSSTNQGYVNNQTNNYNYAVKQTQSQVAELSAQITRLQAWYKNTIGRPPIPTNIPPGSTPQQATYIRAQNTASQSAYRDRKAKITAEYDQALAALKNRQTNASNLLNSQQGYQQAYQTQQQNLASPTVPGEASWTSTQLSVQSRLSQAQAKGSASDIHSATTFSIQAYTARLIYLQKQLANPSYSKWPAMRAAIQSEINNVRDQITSDKASNVQAIQTAKDDKQQLVQDKLDLSLAYAQNQVDPNNSASQSVLIAPDTAEENYYSGLVKQLQGELPQAKTDAEKSTIIQKIINAEGQVTSYQQQIENIKQQLPGGSQFISNTAAQIASYDAAFNAITPYQNNTTPNSPGTGINASTKPNGGLTQINHFYQAPVDPHEFANRLALYSGNTGVN